MSDRQPSAIYRRPAGATYLQIGDLRTAGVPVGFDNALDDVARRAFIVKTSAR